MSSDSDSSESDAGATDCGYLPLYVDAAFRSSRENEVYLFGGSAEYVLVNYGPDQKVVDGPLFVYEGFPSLVRTLFGWDRIDCAFGSQDKDQAFIFSGNSCAQINYDPGTTKGKIIKGPLFIDEMFGCFKGMKFERGVDAAFETLTRHEAFIFMNDQYALINYNNPKLIATGKIIDRFPGLRGTIFETAIIAAFASHRHNEAYLLNGDSCACINFKDGEIIGDGVKKITDNWPSFDSILPFDDGDCSFADIFCEGGEFEIPDEQNSDNDY